VKKFQSVKPIGKDTVYFHFIIAYFYCLLIKFPLTKLNAQNTIPSKDHLTLK